MRELASFYGACFCFHVIHTYLITIVASTKNMFFALISLFFFIFYIFNLKNVKTHIFTSGWSVQHSNSSQNIQQPSHNLSNCFSSPSYRSRHTSSSSTSYRPHIALTSPPSLSTSRRGSITSLYDYDSNKHYINKDPFLDSKLFLTQI